MSNANDLAGIAIAAILELESRPHLDRADEESLRGWQILLQQIDGLERKS